MSLVAIFWNKDRAIGACDGRVMHYAEGHRLVGIGEDCCKFHWLTSSLLLAATNRQDFTLEIVQHMREVVRNDSQFSGAAMKMERLLRQLPNHAPEDGISIALIGYDESSASIRCVNWSPLNSYQPVESSLKDDGANFVTLGWPEARELFTRWLDNLGDVGRKNLVMSMQGDRPEALYCALREAFRIVSLDCPKVNNQVYFAELSNPARMVNLDEPIIKRQAAEGLGQTLGRLNSSGELINADDIAADGTTYARVTLNQRLGAARAYNRIDANDNIVLHNVAVVNGSTSGPVLTCDGTYQLVTDLSITRTTNGNQVYLSFAVTFKAYDSFAAYLVTFAIFCDTTRVSPEYTIQVSDDMQDTATGIYIDSPNAASHTFTVKCKAASGVYVQLIGIQRSFSMIELG